VKRIVGEFSRCADLKGGQSLYRRRDRRPP
jgi:hypothetical protein